MIPLQQIFFQEALNKVQTFIEKEGFKGWDPWDTLNSPLPFHWLGKWGQVIAIQLQKRNPINLRPLLGIKKGYNPKGIGLLLQGYSILYQLNPDPDIKKHAEWLFKWLIDNPSRGYNHLCWGYNFGWASPVKYLPPYSPTIVASGFVAKGMFEYYQTFKDERAKTALIDIGEFVLHDLPFGASDEGHYFSYSTKELDCCYNASMLGAEIMGFLYHLTKDEKYKEIAMKATNFVMAQQQEDGHWNYSKSLESNKERVQIDFHQGYILDSLNHILQFVDPQNEKLKQAINKGLKYYANKQFTKEGRAFFRMPAEYPVEIHNQTQGIITLSRLKAFMSGNIEQAETIAIWTIKNMQGKDGHFYYKKYPLFTIKTPFMRWSQAWMFLALAELLRARTTDK